MTKAGKIFLTCVGVVLFLTLFCVRIVGVGKVGIVTRFGNVNREWSSGLHVKLPWPIESETTMNVQNQKVQVDATAATQDLQTVTTTVALNFNLTPKTANDIYKNVGGNYQSVIIDPILQETVKAITSQYNATDLVQQRPKVEAQTLAALNKALAPRGITVDNFSIVNFEYSSQFASAIENKQVEQTNVQAAQYKLQQAQLNAQANSVQDASLTPDILEQQAINKWDGKMPQVVGGSSSIFGINLQGQ